MSAAEPTARRSWWPFRRRAPETRAKLTIDEHLFESWARAPGASGVVVTPDVALRVAIVFACVRVISETAASLPCLLYRRLSPKGRERAREERLFSILHDLPNPETTAFEFWEYLFFCACLHGNGYAQIVSRGDGSVDALWQLQAKYVRPERLPSGRLLFHYTPPLGEARAFARDELLWIRGPSKDGLLGMEISEEAREAIGLAIAIEDFGARFFANGAAPSGILKAPGVLKPEAQERLRKGFEDFATGRNARRIAVLEGGLDYTKVSVDPEEGQMLESRVHQVAEICGIFRVPPHKVARLDKATFSNIEHQGLEFVTDTMRPWLVRAEQALYRDVLTTSERERLYVEFLVDGLLRGDFKTRMEGYAVARINGWMNPNEIRERENLNPRTDPGGDEYLTPMNMRETGTAPGAPGPGVPSPRRDALPDGGS